LDRHRLLGMPRRTVVERAQDTGAEPGQRVELLDRRIGAVRKQRAGPCQRAVGVGALGLACPEAVGEVAVGRGVAELDGSADAELREARQLLWRQQLRVLDALAQAERLPRIARLSEGVERV